MKFVGHGLSVYVLLQLVIYSEESYHIASCIYINSILWLLFTLNKLQNLINRLVMNCSMNIFVSIYLSMYLSMLGTCAESCKNATSRTIIESLGGPVFQKILNIKKKNVYFYKYKI